MICPNCGHDNLPGTEECSNCLQDLTQLDLPMAQDRVERSLMTDPVASLHPHKPVTIRPTSTIREAIPLMLDHDIGSVLVVDRDGRLLGIFSERDLLTKVVGLHEQWEELPVAQFMTAQPETVTGRDTLAFALHKMDVGGYRHLPIVTDGRASGVLSVRDMLRYITRLCKESRNPG